MIAEKVRKALRENRGTPEKRKILSGFFKCGKGQYGEGDKFLGVPVPRQRAIAKSFFREATLHDVAELLASAYHEDRLTGLFLLVYRFERAEPREQKAIFRFYVGHTDRINNWDLVDVTCPNIVGSFLLENPQEWKRVERWIRSKNMWERRMAVLSSFPFIRKGECRVIFGIAEALMNDAQDLIQKAIGWMLREAGKRDEKALRNFLDTHGAHMPRTMLRYAIERFSKEDRKTYLEYGKGKK